MAYFWFKGSNGFACYCDTCRRDFYWSYKYFKPYEDRGLILEDHTTVNIPLIKLVGKIWLDRLNEIHQPIKLEYLCGNIIKGNTDLIKQLPKSFAHRIKYSPEYRKKIEPNFVEDLEFIGIAKSLPCILYEHLGFKIIRNEEYPD